MDTALTDKPQKRRSRMRRQSSGRRIELSPRDIEIFRLLRRYRYLRSNFLYAFVGGRHETHFKERLGRLYHDGGYLDRPEEQWSFANARYAPVVYELDERGKAVLREYELQDDLGSQHTDRNRPGAARHFAHTLMICETLASIELAASKSETVRFIPWPEILTKAPEKTRNSAHPFCLPVTIAHSFPRSGRTESATFSLIPDGVFGLEYRQLDGRPAYRFFALEVERANRVEAANLRQTSFLKKALAYRDIVARQTHRAQLGLPNLLVLTVVTSKPKIKTMKALIVEVTNGKGSGLFLFKDAPVLDQPFAAAAPIEALFTDVWERARHVGLRIDRP